jgi:hypothetical protein
MELVKSANLVLRFLVVVMWGLRKGALGLLSLGAGRDHPGSGFDH